MVDGSAGTQRHPRRSIMRLQGEGCVIPFPQRRNKPGNSRQGLIDYSGEVSLPYTTGCFDG